MLSQKEEVKHEADPGQAELGGVAGEGVPVAAVVGDQDHLHEAGQAATQVQQDVTHTPAPGALMPVVCPGLRNVLDQSDDQLEGGQDVEGGEPGGGSGQGEADRDDDHQTGDNKEDATWDGDRLVALLHDEALTHRDGGGEEGVQAEHHVIELDGDHAARVLGGVLGPHLGVVVEAEVVSAVETEAKQVEDNKVKVEARDTFPLEVHKYLGIERDGPQAEVKPANQMDEHLKTV